MQSGIAASEDLHNAFKQLVASSDQRALLAGIEQEQLVPLHTIPARASRVEEDLDALQSHLTPTEAVYILLKTDASAPDGHAAITYVPNAASVRQKMLFASTRLTLARELGLERFRQQIFATEAAELSKDGWAKHEAHTRLDAPLTEEEAGLKGVKDAEAAESTGTSGRRGHVSGRVDVKTGEGVTEALSLLKQEGCRGTLVQLKLALPQEVLSLDSSTDNITPHAVAATIHAAEPRYSFYSTPGASRPQPEIVFIYTCPTSSNIKERMIYSTGKSWTRTVAERDAGITVSRSLEATEPGELSARDLGGDADGGVAQAAGETAPSAAGGSGFARPKRPGRR